MVGLQGSTQAVALSSSWTEAGSLKVYPSKIVLVSALCVYMHTHKRFIGSYGANTFRI